MFLGNPDIELLDDDFERLAPLLDVRVSELLAFRFDNPESQLQLSWSTDEPLEFETLPRPFDAWRDKFKDRGAIIAARKQGYRSIAIGGHRLPFGVKRIWWHIDYAKRMRSIVISSQEWMKSYLDVNIEDQPLIVKALDVLPSLLIEEQYSPSMILGCSASLRTLLDFVGTTWLGETAMDVAIASVLASSRVEASTAPDKVYGSKKHHPDSPQRNVLDKYIFTSPLVAYQTLADLRSFIRARPQLIWFLPLCFRNHWAMARVDVGQRTWTIFNSLSNVRIDEITRKSAFALFDYLELHILNTEPKQGRMAQQADSFSCEPAAINVIETELLLVPPFLAGRAHIARIRQFHRLATFATNSQNFTHDLPAPIAGIDKNDLDVGVFEEMAEMEDAEETWSKIGFSSDSETDDDCTTENEIPRPGESITARRARLAKEHFKDIEYSKARPAAFAEFKAKVKQLCPGSDVKITNPRTVHAVAVVHITR